MEKRTLPHPDGMVSYWRTELDALNDHRSTPNLPSEVDVVVVGAGFAGAATAHHILDLSKEGGNPSILILEARQACSGATGRNGGHIKPDPYRTIAEFAADYGMEAAAECANFEASNVDALKDFVEKENIDCDLVITRAIDVQLSRKHCARLKAGYDGLVHAGVEAARKAFFIPEKAAEGVTGVKGAVGGFSCTAGHLWPYKLVMGTLSRLLKRGVNLQTHTPVDNISETRDSSGRWVVQTPRGAVRAKWIVIATNGYTASVLPQYKGKIVPVRGICSRIVCNDPAPLLQCTYTIRWSSWETDYLIPRSDGSIVVGGARTTFFKDTGSWYNNTDDSQLIDAAKSYFDGYMQRNFRGWENSGARTDRVWTGIMGYSSDSLPHIGQVPGKPCQMMLAGFTGHGMPEIFLAAKGVARMIVDGIPFEDTSLPRLYKTTQARLDSKVNKIMTAAAEEPRVRL